MNKNILLTIIAAILFGVAGFFGGMKYQQGKSAARVANFRSANGQMVLRNGNQNSGNFRPVIGEIIASDDKSITVKSDDGSTKIVLLSDSTSVNKAESGSKDDLKNGEKVMVVGTSNSDGSVSAQNIQLNPENRGFFRQTQQ